MASDAVKAEKTTTVEAIVLDKFLRDQESENPGNARKLRVNWSCMGDVQCASCGFNYCPGCNRACPRCGSIYIVLKDAYDVASFIGDHTERSVKLTLVGSDGRLLENGEMTKLLAAKDVEVASSKEKLADQMKTILAMERCYICERFNNGSEGQDCYGCYREKHGSPGRQDNYPDAGNDEVL